jgi:hypothetical protein
MEETWLYNYDSETKQKSMEWRHSGSRRRRHFTSDVEVISGAETWLDGQRSEFFISGLQKLEQRLKSVLSFVGRMLNKFCSLSPSWSG